MWLNSKGLLRGAPFPLKVLDNVAGQHLKSPVCCALNIPWRMLKAIEKSREDYNTYCKPKGQDATVGAVNGSFCQASAVRRRPRQRNNSKRLPKMLQKPFDRW